MSDATHVAVLVVETCWTTAEASQGLARLVSPSYVHHGVLGDGSLDDVTAGLRYVDSVFAERLYVVDHVVEGDGIVAAYLRWSATRVATGERVDGRGAYHCRVVDGLITEDWDVFFPMS